MNKLLKRSAARLPITDEVVTPLDLMESEVVFSEEMSKIGDSILTDSILDVTDTISGMVYQEQGEVKPGVGEQALITKLANSFVTFTPAFDSGKLTEDFPGNEDLTHFSWPVIIILYLTVFGTFIIFASFLIKSVQNIFNLLTGRIEKVKAQEINFSKIDTLSSGGDKFDSDDIEDLTDILKKFADTKKFFGYLMDMVQAHATLPKEKAVETVNGLVKKLAGYLDLDNDSEDGRFGKGVKYYYSDPLPGDKGLFLYSSDGNLPTLTVLDYDDKKYEYDKTVKAMSKKDTHSFATILKELSYAIKDLGENKSSIKEFDADLKSVGETVAKSDDAIITPKELLKYAKQTKRTLAGVPSFVKYSKGVSKASLDLAERFANNLEEKD